MRWLGAATATFVLAGIQLPPASAEGEEGVKTGRAQVRLQAKADGAISVYVDGQPALTTGATSQPSQTQAIGGVAFSWSKDRQFLIIQGKEKEVVVEADSFKDWAAKVGTNDILEVRLDATKRVMDFIHPVENREPVVMRFGDGAKAALKPGSTARFDLFDDQSYYLSGQGRVETVNADGLEKALNTQWPPMAGGQLVSTNDAGGKAHLQRITPITHISIAGTLRDATPNAVVSTNQELTILAGDRRISLRRGESREAVMPNGSVIDFSFPPDAYRLDWRVRKGLFYITIQGFECWQAVAITDQRGGYQWDLGSRAIDVTNQTPTDEHPPNKSILCTLSRTFTARGTRVTIAPRSLFQYIQIQNCDIWAGSGDGDTKLYSPNTERPIDLAKGNVLVRSGLPARPGAEVPKQRVGLTWNPSEPLEVSSAKGGARIPPGTQRTVPQGDFGELSINYSSPGIVSITAVGGSYTLQPKVLDNWTFNVLQGDGVSFNLDLDKGLFIVTANPNNTFSVDVSVPSRSVPSLGPGDAWTYVVRGTGIETSRWEHVANFFEPAGANSPMRDATAPLTRQSPPEGGSIPVVFGYPINPLQPRIFQPPASVVGVGP